MIPKVLIVDDNSESIDLLEELLDCQYGRCECFSATNGNKGVELFERAKVNGKPFDVVLLDIVMPGMGGIDALKKMRKIDLSDKQVQLFGKKSVKTRIIMQTASTDPDDFKSSFLEGRCNGYITKPYSKDEITEKVFGPSSSSR